MKKLYFLVLVLITNFTFAQGNLAVTPNEVLTNSQTNLVVKFTPDQTYPQGTIFKLRIPKGFDNLYFPVFSNITAGSQGSSNISIKDMQKARYEYPTIWPHDSHPLILTLEVRNADLLANEVITISLGNNVARLKTSVTIGDYEFKLATFDEGVWTEIATAPIVNVPNRYKKIDAYLPSIVKKGETAILKLAALDIANNRDTDFDGTFEIEVPTLNFNTTVTFSPSDKGYLEVPIPFSTNGFHNAIVTEYDESSNNPDVFTSNYAWVKDNPDYYIYWGDLHSHSSMSRDGIGQLPFEYAKYSSCLDFYANSEHVDGFQEQIYGIDPEEYEYIKEKVVEFHEPNEFISILAYETTFNALEGGNHIAYYNVDDNLIDSIPPVSTDIAPDVWSLWNYLDGLPNYVDALAWPHFTGSAFYEGGSNNPTLIVGQNFLSKYRPIYEMYSSHGQCEYYNPDHELKRNHTAFWFVQDALAQGEKVGFIGSSDNHNAKPGQKEKGFGAVFTTSLNRDNLFQAFKDRATYSTTGGRAIIDLRANGAVMGSEIDIPEETVPNFDILVHGDGDIDFVELVKWNFMQPEYGDDVHPDFTLVQKWDVNGLKLDTTLTDNTFSGNSVYYLRMRHVDNDDQQQSWAWSSPIFVNGENTVTNVLNSFIEEMQLYPSLVTQETQFINLQIQSKQQADVQISIYDILSREMQNTNHELASGSNLIQIGTKDLSSGRYFVAIKDNNGNKLNVKSFVVQ